MPSHALLDDGVRSDRFNGLFRVEILKSSNRHYMPRLAVEVKGAHPESLRPRIVWKRRTLSVVYTGEEREGEKNRRIGGLLEIERVGGQTSSWGRDERGRLGIDLLVLLRTLQ